MHKLFYKQIGTLYFAPCMHPILMTQFDSSSICNLPTVHWNWFGFTGYTYTTNDKRIVILPFVRIFQIVLHLITYKLSVEGTLGFTNCKVCNNLSYSPVSAVRQIINFTIIMKGSGGKIFTSV